MRGSFRFLRAICTALGVLVLVVIFSPLMPWMVRDMAVDWYSGDGDVLVVLGGSMLVDGTGPQATLGLDSYLRCTYAAWVLQRYQYRFVVLSGPDGLAENMAKLLTERGVNAQLLVERSAHTTEQNAEFVKNILDHQAGMPAHPKIVILTSDFHTRRARLVFEHQGMPVRVIPVPDVGKRIQFRGLRWDAFLTVVDEFAKYGFYKVSGKI